MSPTVEAWLRIRRTLAVEAMFDKAETQPQRDVLLEVEVGVVELQAEVDRAAGRIATA
jgi:hypothetical protein